MRLVPARMTKHQDRDATHDPEFQFSEELAAREPPGITQRTAISAPDSGGRPRIPRKGPLLYPGHTTESPRIQDFFARIAWSAIPSIARIIAE
jgi:hypothetical protein